MGTFLVIFTCILKFNDLSYKSVCLLSPLVLVCPGTIGWLCSLVGDISGYIHHLYFKTVGNITQTNLLATSLSVSVRHCTMGWVCSVVGDISGNINHLYFKTVGNITLTNLLAILLSGICSSRYNRLVMFCGLGHS